ncbi:alpha/beta fold hydrolase [Flavobacterium urocaniciphilum]|nr:alpha/beta hydrolase [Flavobacterium urocaniciphilum]
MQTETKLSLDKIAIKKIGNYSNKPTIIFLHDSLGCIELWRDFPQQLSDFAQCNVLVYDRQGYGKSSPFSYSKRDNYYVELEADILNELLNYWQIEKAILFGHSDGGSIALITAAKYPTKILGIITEGAHVFVEDITLKGINEAKVQFETTDLKTKLEKYHGEKTEAMFWAWASTWTTDEFKSWNIENFLPMIECNSLIIQGEEDEFGSLMQVESIVKNSRGNSEKLIIPNIKHNPHKETPELILEKSSEFINQFTNEKF